MASSDLPLKTYHGNCRCGDVRFEIKFPSLEDGAEVVTCDCSICVKNGYLFIYPENENVKYTRGWEKLKPYQFANKVIDHMFCPNCGTSTSCFSEKYNRNAINIRTFQDLDVSKLKLKYVEMKNSPPLYEPGP